MKISIHCKEYDCYWNIGEEFLPEGNCACRDLILNDNVSESMHCNRHIEKDEALRRLDNAFKL